MTVLPTHTQLSLLPSRPYAQPGFPIPAELYERMEMLVPGVKFTTVRNVQEYALAYVEHYQGNVLALEHEWEFLSVSLESAWQQGHYEIVARLASTLAYPAGRRNNLVEATRVLRPGIVASRCIQDRRRFATLLNRLGGLLFVHGRYQLGHRLWHTGLSHIESGGPPQGLWEPLFSFTQMADILGNYAAAQHFLQTFYHAHLTDDPDGLAVALFVRGLYARFMDNMEQAAADFGQCLRLLIPQAPLPSRQLLIIIVQAELARAQGHDARSRQYTQTAQTLAQAFGDLHTYVTLLIDEGMVAYRQGRLDDIQRVFALLRGIEGYVGFPNIVEVNRLLEQRLVAGGALSPQPEQQRTCSGKSTGNATFLSEREKEVLSYVAIGLSSRDIATRLVVSPVTVKKHLEHIYTKLDVHNRTSAVAQARSLNILA